MAKIGGNIVAYIQIKETVKNEIGERVPSWITKHSPKGWLDLSSGDSKHTSFNAKIQESTHIFLCDYFEMDASIKAENSRMFINGKVYEVLLIDNPMELNQHYEIYLKYTGGQNG